MVFHASAKRLIIISDCPGNKQTVYVATCWSIPVTAWTTWHLTPGNNKKKKVKFTKQTCCWEIFGDLWFGPTQTWRDSEFPVLASKQCRLFDCCALTWVLYIKTQELLRTGIGLNTLKCLKKGLLGAWEPFSSLSVWRKKNIFPSSWPPRNMRCNIRLIYYQSVTVMCPLALLYLCICFFLVLSVCFVCFFMKRLQKKLAGLWFSFLTAVFRFGSVIQAVPHQYQDTWSELRRCRCLSLILQTGHRPPSGWEDCTA